MASDCIRHLFDSDRLVQREIRPKLCQMDGCRPAKPPMDWIGGFDLVLEIHTLQAMPEELRAAAAKKLAPLVSENGHLVCIGRYASGDVGIEGPPWPLERSFIEGIGQDLGSMNLVKFRLPFDEISVTRFRATWERRMVKIN